MQTQTTTDAPGARDGYWRALLHRWLVEFNPLYLLSAALVLAGTFLCSRGLAEGGSVDGSIAVAGIAELYALALVGGAAILVRLGHRRPAVMLGLLTVLYQNDLTLHTEACANLGVVGRIAAAGWLALFALKLAGLAWALRLRPSRSAVAAALLGGAGLALFPFALRHTGATEAGALVAAWVFAVVSLQRTARLESLVPLDAWGHTVLRRASRATWLLSGGLLAGHVFFWSTTHHLALGTLAIVLPLLLVRAMRAEQRVWITTALTLLVTGAIAPVHLALAAVLATAALLLRAFLPTLAPTMERVPETAAGEGPYRAASSEDAPLREASADTAIPAIDRALQHRLLAGALFTLHLAVWTAGWAGGPWPAHVVPLDLGLTLVAMLAVVRLRVRAALAPVLAIWGHLVVAARLLPTPRTSLEWGAASVVLGFVLLGGSLAATWRLRRT